MTNIKKTKISNSIPAKRVQFNLTAREDHTDYQILLLAKELFALLAQNAKLSRASLLLKLVKSFTLTGNFITSEKQLIAAAANHEGISIEEFCRRATLLYANKILSKQIMQGNDGEDSESDNKGASREFIAKTKSKADLKVERIVAEMMQKNDAALAWQDKREITARSVNDWGKHAATSVAYKTINQLVLKRYFMLHRETIKQHHYKHNIKPDHNRRVFAAKNKSLRQAESSLTK